MSDKFFSVLIASLLIVVAAVSRIVPHPWNFTPVIAMALFAGARLERTSWAVAGMFLVLALGDLAIGAFPYAGLPWVYGTLLVVTLIGRRLAKEKGLIIPLAYTIGTGALFYAVTNLGVWLQGGLYSRTFDGLFTCYVAGLPFYRNQLVGDLLFSSALFGAFALASKIRIRFAGQPVH